MTKLTKILERLTKKATSDVKGLAQAVLDNAAAASARKALAAKDKPAEKLASPQAVGSPADGSRKDAVAGVKRLREGDGSAPPAAKKVVKAAPPSSKPLAVRMEEKRRAEELAKRAQVSDKSVTALRAALPAPGANAAAKAKVAVAAPAKSSMFSALSSVSKKPGTSNAERAAAAAREKTTSTATAAPAPPRPMKRENGGRDSPPHNVGPGPMAKSATSSSFMNLLTGIDKKPEKEVKKEDEVPNETEEQKGRRLRKEARRKLRVSWKADDDLVETHFFTHDPDEELDQGDRLKANAGGGREGEALKQHKNMEDLEDEGDEDSFEELEEYSPPSEIDFTYLEDSSLGDDSPHELNPPKFGGLMKPVSPSTIAQDKYEQDTLMAIYTSKAERPATPKEPDDTKEDDNDFEPAEPETPFGEPPEHIRQREKEYLARQAQLRPQPTIDLAALVSAASQQKPQQQSGVIPTELQRALSMYGQPAQPTPQPQAAPAPNVDLQAILSALGRPQAQQSLYPAATQAAYTNTSNVSALLASMQPGAQAQPALSTTTTSLPLGMGSNPNPFPGSIDDASRKHARSDSADIDTEYGRKSGTKKKKGAGAGVDPNKPYNYKTQICTFWEQGKCLKGDGCTYRHGDTDGT